MKLRDKIAMLMRVAPKASRFGQLYKTVAETRIATKRIVLWTLFVSDEDEHMIRDHVFESREHRTPKEWHDWFARPAKPGAHRPAPMKGESELEYIQRTSVLPGLSTRTGLKSWAVERVIGWRADVKHKARNSALGRKRNKTKPKRRKGG